MKKRRIRSGFWRRDPRIWIEVRLGEIIWARVGGDYWGGTDPIKSPTTPRVIQPDSATPLIR